MGDFVDKWAKGDLFFVKTVQEIGGGGHKDVRVTDPGMGSSHSHLQVINAEKALRDKISSQIGRPELSARAQGCSWFTTRDLGEGGLPDLHRRRMIFAMLDE